MEESKSAGKLDSLLSMYGSDECAARLHALANQGIASGDPIALELLVLRDAGSRGADLTRRVMTALESLSENNFVYAANIFESAYRGNCGTLADSLREWEYRLITEPITDDDVPAPDVSEDDLYELLNEVQRLIVQAESGQRTTKPLHELRAVWAFVRGMMNAMY